MNTTAGLKWWMIQTDGGYKLDKGNSRRRKKIMKQNKDCIVLKFGFRKL